MLQRKAQELIPNTAQHGALLTKDLICGRAADLGATVFVDDVAKTNFVKHRSKLGAMTLDTERKLEKHIAEADLSLNKGNTVHLPACRGPGAHRRLSKTKASTWHRSQERNSIHWASLWPRKTCSSRNPTPKQSSTCSMASGGQCVVRRTILQSQADAVDLACAGCYGDRTDRLAEVTNDQLSSTGKAPMQNTSSTTKRQGGQVGLHGRGCDQQDDQTDKCCNTGGSCPCH